MRIFICLLLVFVLGGCQSASVKSKDPDFPLNAYLQGKDNQVGIILCHGRGHDPEWFVVDPLRRGIHQQLGYHTLSIQMPIGDIGWKEYKDLFPEAYKNIAASVRFLKDEKKIKKVYLMGHSMGSRMASSFLANYPESAVDGFIGIGVRNGGGVPLDSNMNLRKVSIPVLDVYGNGNDAKDAKHANARSDMVSNRYQQVLISGADHLFTDHEKEMVSVVVQWLKTQSDK